MPSPPNASSSASDSEIGLPGYNRLVPPCLHRVVALASIALLTAAPSAGCMRTTSFPAAEIPRLRPLMQGEPPGTSSVVLEGNYPARIRRDTELELVIMHRGREMRANVTPARLGWRTDGLWVDESYVPRSDIVGMEMSSFSLGRTIGFSLLCAGGLIIGLVVTAVYVSSIDNAE